MKKISKNFLGAVLAVTLLSITIGCDKETKPKDDSSTTGSGDSTIIVSGDSTIVVQVKTLTVDASNYGKWVYISFSSGLFLNEQGEEVELDYQNDLSWDMALHRYDVRLNGGESGKGQGAALETIYTELNEVTVIPESGYILDVMDSIMASAAMPPVYEAQPYNLEASKWMNVNTSKMPPSYTLSDKVYIFKTAEGKHVKIIFTDYRNAEDKTGHIKFSYAYMD
ncbi:MAG: HmuY family protein [Bacteroidales bacterium]|jgi:hypothetical protein|nr:HmuY family protein [Bacteroidales bacterium]